MSPITHIVLLGFKSSANVDTVSHISQKLLALKDGCLHPTSLKPYIKSVSGGTDNSPEGLQNGITHIFVVEFENEEDRDYYVHKDPVHEDFKKLLGQHAENLEKAQVIDFSPGVFKA